MGDRECVGPIYSRRADDPAWTDAIDAFVVGLAERIDYLQDAEGSGDFVRVASLSAALRHEAGEVGFEGLADCAAGVERATRAEKLDAAYARLVELTDIAQRIRLGHRGAL
jgi:hypothetical protein